MPLTTEDTQFGRLFKIISNVVNLNNKKVLNFFQLDEQHCEASESGIFDFLFKIKSIPNYLLGHTILAVRFDMVHILELVGL